MIVPSGSGINGLTKGFTKKLARFVRCVFIGEIYPLALLAAPPPASPLSRSRSPPPRALFNWVDDDSEDEDGDEKGCLVVEVKGIAELSRGILDVFSPNRTEHWMGLSLTFKHSNDTRASSTPDEMKERYRGVGEGIRGVLRRALYDGMVCVGE